MIPSHNIVTKLSRNSLIIVRRSSTKLSQTGVAWNVSIQRRSFITILNPSGPKVIKIRKNSLKEASEHIVETEKIILLRKALAEASVATPLKQDSTNDAAEVESSIISEKVGVE